MGETAAEAAKDIEATLAKLTPAEEVSTSGADSLRIAGVALLPTPARCAVSQHGFMGRTDVQSWKRRECRQDLRRYVLHSIQPMITRRRGGKRLFLASLEKVSWWTGQSHSEASIGWRAFTKEKRVISCLRKPGQPHPFLFPQSSRYEPSSSATIASRQASHYRPVRTFGSATRCWVFLSAR